MKPAAPFLFIALAAGILTSGCDRLGFPDPATVAATAEAEGKAVGAACRNAGRGLEDCYQKNPKASKPAVFAGWKDMNEYMTQNKMEVIEPPPPPPPPPPPKSEEEEDEKALAGSHGKDGGKADKGGKAPKDTTDTKDTKEEKPAKNAKHG